MSSKMNVGMLRKIAFAVGLSLVGAAYSASTCYWKGGDGEWADASKWSVSPTASQDVYFAHGGGFSPSGERASVVTVSGSVYMRRLLLDEFQGSWSGEIGSWDTCPVTFVGPGTLCISDRPYSGGSSNGRDVHFKDIAVVMTNHLDASGDVSYIAFRGHTLWKNSSFSTTAASLYLMNGADFVLDNVDFDFKRLYMQSDIRLLFKSGTFKYITTASGTSFSCPNVDIRDGAIKSLGGVTCTAKEWLPSGTNGLLFIDSGDGAMNLEPTLAKGDKVRLRGTFMSTNSVSSCIRASFTNDCTVYGRGALLTGFVNVRPGVKVDFDLGEIVLARRFWYNNVTPDVAAELNFRNGTLFGCWSARNDATTASYVKTDILANFYGDLVMDAWDRRRDIATTFSMRNGTTRCYNMQERSGIVFKRGTVEGAYLRKPVRFARYVLGEGVTVKELDYGASTPTDLRTHYLKIGANASWSALSYGQVLDANGEVEIDPSATITVPLNPSITDDTVEPVFVSLLDEKPDCTFQYTNQKAGFEVKWVGGCGYYTSGNRTYGVSNGRWTGSSSGYWSESANWGNGTMPSQSGITASLFGQTNTLITNDLEKAYAYSIYADIKSAPFIIRGNPVVVSSVNCAPNESGASVMSVAEYPFIMEAQLVATGNRLGLTHKHGSRGGIALKGGFAFDPVAQPTPGQLVPSGFITLGGTSVCGDLKMELAITPYVIAYRAHLDRDYSRRSELTIMKGGSLTVQNQTTVNATTASLWIARGGQMKVSGTWNWDDVPNEHQVDGILDLDATVGGNATQGYFGSGTLKVKTTDGSAGASMRLGEGLILAPSSANWGSMPIDMPSDLVISNAADWTYGVAGGLEVSGPGHRLTVDCAGTTTFATAITGYAFDICKRGPGALVLDEVADGLARGTLDIQGGRVVFRKPQSIERFAFGSGATIAVGSSNGQVASLTVRDDVDLDGLTLTTADSGTAELMRQDFVTILSVPWGFELSGEPTFAGDAKWRVRQNADGSTALQAKVLGGFMMIVR